MFQILYFELEAKIRKYFRIIVITQLLHIYYTFLTHGKTAASVCVPGSVQDAGIRGKSLHWNEDLGSLVCWAAEGQRGEEP